MSTKTRQNLLHKPQPAEHQEVKGTQGTSPKRALRRWSFAVACFIVLVLAVSAAASNGLLQRQVTIWTRPDLSLTLDGREVQSDVPPFILQGRVFVPIRFVSEALGLDVKWNEKNYTVEISSPAGTPSGPVTSIAIPPEPTKEVLARLRELSPKEPNTAAIDAATREAGFAPVLLNYHLASRAELPVGPAVYLPRQISEHDGGRESLWTLEQGKEILTGIYVTGDGIVLRYVKRESGRTKEAADGDLFSTRLTTAEGKTLARIEGTFKALDRDVGLAELESLKVTYTAPGWETLNVEKIKVRIWLFWSKITVTIEVAS